jgi:nitroreductase
MTNGITMTNAIIESIVSRSTTKYYDPAVTLSDDQIRELVRIATTAPTSFHMQNVTHPILPGKAIAASALTSLAQPDAAAKSP